MSTMEAVGAYVRTLREANRMTRAEVAKAAGTHESQIVRVEAGEQEPRGPLFLRIIHAVKGSADNVMQLVLKPDATAADGQELARQWLNQEEYDSMHKLYIEYEGGGMREVIEKIRRDLTLLEERVDARDAVNDPQNTPK